MTYYDMNGDPVTSEEWFAIWAGDPNDGMAGRRVGYDDLGDVNVSTVLLAMDHNFGKVGPPLIFETMIFGGEHNGEQWRYATREEAQEGHARAVALVRGES